MTSKPWQRWQDWTLLVAGIWLFAAPWAFTTTADTNSSGNAWLVGVLVSLTALWALARPQDESPGWFQVLFGAWLFAAPWALDFTGSTQASWNAWLLGATIVGLAWWELVEQSSTRRTRTGPIRDDVAHGSH